MLAALLMEVSGLGIRKTEDFVDSGLKPVQRNRPVHSVEHFALADMNAQEADRLAIDHTGVDGASAGERANDADGAAGAHYIH